MLDNLSRALHGLENKVSPVAQHIDFFPGAKWCNVRKKYSVRVFDTLRYKTNMYLGTQGHRAARNYRDKIALN